MDVVRSGVAHRLGKQNVLSLGIHFVVVCGCCIKKTSYISRDLDQSTVAVLIPLDVEFRSRDLAETSW
jgi:hypothetical protein